MNRHTSISTTISLIVVGVLLYIPASTGIRHVIPAFAQSSTDCTNNGSNQVNADVSRHSNTEGSQVQSQANQCSSPTCPAGNTGTATTEDGDEQLAGEEQIVEGPGEVSATGSCFPAGEDEPSGSEHLETNGFHEDGS